MATAAASSALLPKALGQSAPADGATVARAFGDTGYGTDPDLMRDYQPGDLWPLTFDEHQRRTAMVLCGLIIPADDTSPSAADLKVHDFIDEWISSPYPGQAGDRETIIDGLARLDAISTSRFGGVFVELRATQQGQLCDELAVMENLTASAVAALSPVDRDKRRDQRFFKRFRELTAGGFYTTPEGMKDVGYIGNVPLAAYPSPPAALLERLGLG